MFTCEANAKSILTNDILWKGSGEAFPLLYTQYRYSIENLALVFSLGIVCMNRCRLAKSHIRNEKFLPGQLANLVTTDHPTCFNESSCWDSL